MSLYSFRKVLKADEITVVNSSQPGRGRRIQDRAKNRQAAAEKLSARKGEKANPTKQEDSAVPGDFQGMDTDAYQKGYADGVAAGEKKEQERSAVMIASVEDMISQIQSVRNDFVTRNEKQLIGLVYKIAAALVLTEVTRNDEVIRKTLEDALAALGETEKLTIKCHPGDYDAILSLKPDFLMSKGMESVTIEKDDSISRGGIILETPTGGIDSTIDTRIAAIREALPVQ